MALRASVITSYCRNTGNSSKAAHRLFNAALDFAGGLQQFEATYEQFGRRMLGESKTEDAWKSAVSRDVATHNGERDATGYPGLKVIPGKRIVDKQGNVLESTIASWDFEALPFLVKMLEAAALLEKENRRLPYDRRLKREQLFDEAFRRADVPRTEIDPPHEDGEPDQEDENNKADEDGYNLAVRRSAAYARRARLKLCESGAPDRIQEAARQLFHDKIDQIFDLPPEQLKRKLKDWDFDAAVPPPTVEEEGYTSVADEPQILTQPEEHAGSENDTRNDGFAGGHEHFSENMGTNLEQAQAALLALSSVGVETVNVLFCDDAKYEKLKAERDRLRAEGLKPDEILRRGIDPQKAVQTDETAIPIERLRPLLEQKMARCEKRQWSFIIDPRSIGDRLIMADECDESARGLLKELALYTIETSDGNGQAVLILPESYSTKSQCDEIEDRLFIALKPMGCNKGSSGASRWPGSFNFKPKRQRPDGSFPQVKLLAFNPGRIVTPEELENAGLLPERPKPRPVERASRSRLPVSWPDYDNSLALTDRSAADWKFARAAEKLGWTQTHVEAMLTEISDKAQERSRRNGRYVTQTVSKAFDRPHTPRKPFAARETGVI
jgi:hypothetical protein